jgi:thioesterase domain-containing protein
MAAANPGDVLLGSVVAQINQAAPTGPVTLLGYSYGGRVALMAAHRLIALGRDISLIGIIDTEIFVRAISAAERTQIRLHHLRQEISGTYAFAGLAGVVGFVAARYLHDVVGPARARRSTTLRHSLLSRRSSIVLDRWMGMMLRLEAAAQWRAQKLPPLHHVPTMLFRSEDHGPDAPEDLGWRECCPDVQTVLMRGDHETILDPNNRVPICEALLSAAAVAA